MNNSKIQLNTKTWTPLRTLRQTKEPFLSSIYSPNDNNNTDSNINSNNSNNNIPRLAKDETYARDILKAWNDEFSSTSNSSNNNSSNCSNNSSSTNSSNDNDDSTFGCIFPYKGNSGKDGIELEFSGYLVIPSQSYHNHATNFQSNTNTNTNTNTNNDNNDNDTNTNSNNNNNDKVPVVIIFHTGAGPQDIFNRYQADKLAREYKLWGEKGCIVFIADLLSDSVGWTWGDRDRYWRARKHLLEVSNSDGSGSSSSGSGRFVLQERIKATINAVKSIDEVDVNKIAAIGYCFGGQPILELGRMQCDGVLGLITFHGLFDGVENVPLSSSKNTNTIDSTSTATATDPVTTLTRDDNDDNDTNHPAQEVLICNGAGDPYVTDSDLIRVRKVFENAKWNTKIINFDNVYHNFSNPRTKYDDPDAPFGYDDHATKTSWNAMLYLLQNVFDL